MKAGNVLYNNALNTFIYDHMALEIWLWTTDTERGNPLPPVREPTLSM